MGVEWSLAGAVHLDEGVDDPKKHVTTDMCYLGKSIRSRSNHLGVSVGPMHKSQKFEGR